MLRRIEYNHIRFMNAQHICENCSTNFSSSKMNITCRKCVNYKLCYRYVCEKYKEK